MTKAEWLKELENRIQRLSSQERAEIMADYREHFDMGMENGKTQEQICISLGSPRSIAQSIMMSSLVEEAQSAPTLRGRGHAILRMFLLILVLAPFNFLILVGPFLVLFSLLFAGWVTPLSLIAGSTAAGIVFLQAGVSGFGVLSGLSLFSVWLGIVSASFVVCVIMWLLTRGSLWLLIAFFKWNIEFITEKKS